MGHGGYGEAGFAFFAAGDCFLLEFLDTLDRNFPISKLHRQLLDKVLPLPILFLHLSIFQLNLHMLSFRPLRQLIRPLHRQHHILMDFAFLIHVVVDLLEGDLFRPFVFFHRVGVKL